MAQAIEHHAIVGDMRTCALVARDGTIDFMCWPRFDSPTIFASLLDDDRGGSFQLAPLLDDARLRQLYLPDTNVLLTRFLASDGVAEISDFMPVVRDTEPQRLVRRIKAVRHTMRVRMRCAPRFDYARADHRLRVEGQCAVFEGAGLTLRLWSSVPLRIEDGAAVAELSLAPDESASFVLEADGHGDQHPGPDARWVADAFKATGDYWRSWVARTNYRGRWRDMVNRSALCLKLLTSMEHGSMVAAATFGLPESPGGARNWDYRYTWMRDAAFTVYAFLRLGYTDEANAFMRWLGHRARGCDSDGQLQLMYRIDGSRELPETELPHLRGFGGAVPVRIGNGASDQLQLDIYGELMDAVYLSDKYGEQLSWDGWQAMTRSIDWVSEHWQEPDEGIWEMRTGRQHYLHSRLQCWVALDRAVRLARKRSLPAPLARWIEVRDEIAHDIHRSFWNEEQKAFVQSRGGTALDASCLLMPLVRFISPTDPRWLSTLRAVRERLMNDSLVYRYSIEAESDGFDDEEGTFNLCSFWYVECLARAGDLAGARFHFEKMLGYANHVGLYAEQTGPRGEHLGNFPQAFTHIALISAAFYLDRALSATEGLPYAR
ncbi:MAG: glycoside hydrolase family 15 protein [Polyangiaceae bacterium]